MKLNKFTNKTKGARNKVDSSINKRCLSADGFSLLPSALRPRLFITVTNLKLNILSISIIVILTTIFINLVIINSPSFAIDSCLDSTTPCLNVSIASSISLDLKPISSTGTFAKSDTTTNTVSVMTNYFAGYTLGIAASSNNANASSLIQTAKRNEGTENEETITSEIKSIGTISGVTSSGISEEVFSNASNTQYNNTWGYKVTNLNTTTSTNYLPAPTNTTSISMDTTSAANTETANNYNIAIGARVGTDTPKGSYTNTFVLQVVANPVPYIITFDKGNAEAGTVNNLPSTLNNSTRDTTVTLPGTKPTRSGYVFSGWCSEMPTASNGTDSCSGNIYYQGGTGSRVYPINQTASNTNITLYAIWQEVHNITFTAGNNIDTIIVADSSNNWKPFYITNGGSYTFSNAPAGRRYAVTVVPTANHTLDSWTSTSGSTNNLASNTLLATIYTVGTTNETLTATGSSDANSYTAMQDLTLANCSADGTNVTDLRDKKSYTVKKLTSGATDFCSMLSNLRLDANTELSTTTSNVTAAYTLPPNTNSEDSSTTDDDWVNDYCKPYMAVKNGEYYYNWPAATARTNSSNTSSCSTDTSNSVGDICPANWALPEDGTGALQFNNSDFRTALVNNGSLATTGYFVSGSQYYVGSYGYWWSSTRNNNSYANLLHFYGSSAYRLIYTKSSGFSVRCMRSS